MRFIRLALLAFAAIALGTCLAFRSSERSWYEGLLPLGVKVESILALDTVSGIREGCGAVIFELDPEAVRSFRRDGLSALADARQARDHSEPYFSFEEWSETPYRESGNGTTLKDRWLGGLDCAALNPDLAKTIDEALRSKGSFFSRSEESGLIILPAAGIVVLSFDG